MPQRPATGRLDTRCPVEWGHPLNAGLVGRWQAIPGWTGGDKLRDLTRRGNDGTLTNMASPATSTSGWQTAGGRPGGYGCLAFDQTDDYAVLPASLASLAGTSAATVAIWAMATSSSSAYACLSDNDNAATTVDREGVVIFNNSGQFWARMNTGGSANTAAGGTWSAGVWYRVAVTYDGADIRIYANGVQQGSASGTGAIYASVSALRLGVRGNYGAVGGGPWWWPGQLDDFRVWSRALSPAEAVADYDESYRGSPETLRWLSSRAYFLPAAAGGGAVTADLSVTLAAPTLSASAAVAVAAVATPTLAAPTLSSAGTVSVVAGVSQTLAGPTLSSAASVAVVASLASTLSGVTLSSACAATVAASSTPTLTGPSLSSSCAVTVTASLSATLAGPTLDSNIPAPGGVVATADVTLAGPTLSAACTVTVTAIATQTLSGPTLASACTVSVVASLSATLAGPTLYARIGDAAAAPVVIRIPISSSRVVRVNVSSSRTVRIPISL